jgi:O-antigen/teichoic acid export membrane protein
MANENTERKTSARGFFVNVGSLVSARLFLAFSQILVLPIVARQLDVEDFALMAMAMSVVVFCSVLSDAGLGRSLIRTDVYNEDEWASVFWLLLAVGIGLCLILMIIAPLWARFFDQPQLIWLLVAMSVIPLCHAISATPNAEIERRENYTGIARVQMITTTASLALAVALALSGAGVWALVGQQLSLAIVRLIGICYLTKFRPALAFKRVLIKPHLVFARDALLVSAISTMRSESAVVAIGKFLGETPLGFFAMSSRFTRLPQFGLIGPMSTVVYVRMAKNQKNPAKLIEIYMSAMFLLAAILLPGLAMMAIAGEAIFTVMLSAEWAAVAPIFALSIAGLSIEAIAVVLLACLFRAVGRTDLLVRLTLEGSTLRIVLVIVAAYFFNVEAVAIAISIWGFLVAPRGWHLASRIAPLSIHNCIRVMAIPAIVSIALIAVHVTLRSVFEIGHVAEIGMSGLILIAGFSFIAIAQRDRIRTSIGIFQE